MKKFVSDQSGATAIEYALICALIVLVCVGAFTVMGGGSNGIWQKKIAEPTGNVL